MLVDQKPRRWTKLAIARSIIQRKHTPAPVVETSLLSLWHLRRSLAQTRYTPATLEALAVKAARRLTRLRLWRRHVRCGAVWLRFSHILLDSWAHVAFLSMPAEFTRYPYDALQHRMSQPGGLGDLSEALAATPGLIKQTMSLENRPICVLLRERGLGLGWVLSRNLGGYITTHMG